MKKDLGNRLRIARKNNILTVQDVSDYLIKKGFKASTKTIYSWENGNSEPSPDALLSLCQLYQIKDVLSELGYSKHQSIELERNDAYIDKIIYLMHQDETFKVLLEQYSGLSIEKRTQLSEYANFLSQLEEKDDKNIHDT